MRVSDVTGWLLAAGAVAFAISAILGLVNAVFIRPLRRWVDETRRKDIAEAIHKHQQEDHNRRDGR